MNKNDVLTVEITDQDERGQGIGKVSGFPIFVRHALTGDVVKASVTKVKKNYAYARIVDFNKESHLRIEPPCQVYKRCGGCQLQNMRYEGQLEFKQRRVKEALKRIGGFSNINVQNIIGAHETFRYRNKAQYPVGYDKDGNLVCGFYAERTHEIIRCEDCLLVPGAFGEITHLILEWMKENNITAYDEKTGNGTVRHIFLRKGFATGQIALCLIINSNKLRSSGELFKKLAPIGDISSISALVNSRHDNVILGDRIITLYGNDYIEEKIGKFLFRISPLSFFQVNPEQTKKLYDKIIKFADFKGNETVIDLYCGTGTISIYASSYVKKIYGIETVSNAVENAKENAKINRVQNASFFTGKAEEILPKLYKNGLNKADLVIVDPPRKGCDETALSTMAEIKPKKIIYVSCNPATLARDMKYLKQKGYCPQMAQPVDMFPMSSHVETVVLMSRVSNEPGKTGV